jgi:hypothetical protein
LYGDDGSRRSLGAGARPATVRSRSQPSLEFKLLHVVEFTDSGSIRRENVWVDLAAIIVSFRSERTRIEPAGRPNQRRRTRKDLLQAASTLMKRGATRDSRMSRARPRIAGDRLPLFPERRSAAARASLDVEVLTPATLLGMPADDPSRGRAVEAALYDMITANEPSCE